MPNDKFQSSNEGQNPKAKSFLSFVICALTFGF
jgi:hypothetical protein